jgi:two-component system LytT family sensor kinase
LIRTGAWINLILLVLGISILFFLPNSNISGDTIVLKKVSSFALANIICWVINIFILVFLEQFAPTLKRNKWITFYVSSYAIVFAVALIISRSSFVNLFTNNKLSSPIFSPLFFVATINTLSILIINLILSRYDESLTKLENSELRVKSLEAQQEKLKNQLNPHFLFNSLNALKSLIKRDPNLAENYLVGLSNFLRFSISHSEQNVVSLEQELKFSMYYLEVQKVRFGNAISYSVDIPLLQQMNAVLPVFSLQLTLENAIKHNKLTQEEPLTIRIVYIEPDLLLVENNINPKPHIEPGSGTGLKNLSDRYLLLTKEGIRVNNSSDFFQVYLKLITK